MDHGQQLITHTLRSKHSQTEAYVRFINLTNRRIDIIWVNFTGDLIKYNTICRHQFLDINTFTDHPWIFWDRNTKDSMVVQAEEVFSAIPVHCPTTQQLLRKCVTIQLPVYSLKTRALLAVVDYLKSDVNINEIDLPHVLKDDLKTVIDTRKQRKLLIP